MSVLLVGLSAFFGGMIGLCVLRMPPKEDKGGRRFAFAVIGIVCALLLYTAHTTDEGNRRSTEIQITRAEESAYEAGYQSGWEDAAEEYLYRAKHYAEQYMTPDELFEFELDIQ